MTFFLLSERAKIAEVGIWLSVISIQEFFPFAAFKSRTIINPKEQWCFTAQSKKLWPYVFPSGSAGKKACLKEPILLHILNTICNIKMYSAARSLKLSRAAAWLRKMTSHLYLATPFVCCCLGNNKTMLFFFSLPFLALLFPLKKVGSLCCLLKAPA